MSADNWDAYWRNARSAAAHKDGGPQDEVLERFWRQLFEEILPGIDTGSGLLDIACGNGAVPRFALSSSEQLDENIDLHIYGVDESAAALQEMCKRDAAVKGIAASALQLPFRDKTFELVTSQFGMEYAGAGVFTEAVRILKPGGLIAAVLHLQDGGIYRECEINLRAIEGFRNSNMLEIFEELYMALTLSAKEGGDKKGLSAIDRRFANSVVSAEQVLQRWGKGVASGTLLRIYTDVGHMYRRLNAYDVDELLNWIEVMKAELGTYAGRMSSMLAAALDRAEFNTALVQLNALGINIRVKDTLRFGRQTQPSAWVVMAEKPQT